MRRSFVPPWTEFTFTLIFFQASYYTAGIFKQLINICKLDQIVLNDENTILNTLGFNIWIKNPVVTSFEVVSASNDYVIFTFEFVLAAYNNIIESDEFFLDDLQKICYFFNFVMKIFVLHVHLEMGISEFGERIAESKRARIFVYFKGCFKLIWKIETIFFVWFLVNPFNFNHWSSSLGAIQILLHCMFEFIHSLVGFFDKLGF